MRILVAGATGVIGRPLLHLLTHGGHEVVALTRSHRPVPGATSVVADAMDRAGLLAAVDGLQVDAVVHQLTALKKVPTRESLMATTNALRDAGTANLLGVARATGAGRFVSQSFYGGYGYRDLGTVPLTEDAPFGETAGPFPRTVAAMRAAEEQIFSADGIDGISLRYGGLYGPGAVDGMLEALRRRRLPIARGGVAPWTYVEDAAAATVAALEHGRGGQAYNICDDEAASWLDVVAETARVFEAPAPMVVPGWVVRLVAPYAGALMTRTSMRLSTDKAKDELGWRPSVPGYREGLARTRELASRGA
ncbi:NAD-dependent epimerase/dehydratase family protein [Xylanimonas sp. McL0601]|uniref:NAD-dependent epimerase/dehydratase family protein n=1 Tax=Xylanimonas sp. McL0601 TaxID=3414739 RepID=UPI003CF3C8BC